MIYNKHYFIIKTRFIVYYDFPEVTVSVISPFLKQQKCLHLYIRYGMHAKFIADRFMCTFMPLLFC